MDLELTLDAREAQVNRVTDDGAHHVLLVAFGAGPVARVLASARAVDDGARQLYVCLGGAILREDLT